MNITYKSSIYILVFFFFLFTHKDKIEVRYGCRKSKNLDLIHIYARQSGGDMAAREER
jgi:hypothetical protein